MIRIRSLLITLSLFGFCIPSGFAQPPVAESSAGMEFFENKIRPMLAENCYRCHGEKRQRGNLRVDGREFLLKGTDLGPAIVPGQPEKSRLLTALHYTGELKMPPNGKLPEQTIADVTTWIKMGAPWPGNNGKVEVTKEKKDGSLHWAFQPVQNPNIPQVKTKAWASSPVDHFILAKLEEKGMSPSPEADRRTLLRRAYIDLIGIPPTAKQVEDFAKDRSADAFAKVVDQLLASPLYGERWGRHWLDIARYADTKGYVFTEERRYAFSYTYRDYVIRAFNEDIPYDRFITEQLAADRLVAENPGYDQRALAAMGYLTVGRRFRNNVHDIIDDRIDVVTRGLQGLTVSCARCHDHKYDPIPTEDYYSLYGVFASCHEPEDLPLIGEAEPTPGYNDFKKQLAERQKKVDDFIDTKFQQLSKQYQVEAIDYLLAVRDSSRKPGEQSYKMIRLKTPQRGMLTRWQAFVRRFQDKGHFALTPWFQFAALTQQEFAAKAPALAKRFAENQAKINPLVAQMFKGQTPKSLEDVAKLYDELFQKILAKPGETGAEKQLHRFLTENAPCNITRDELPRLVDRADRDKLRALEKQVNALRATHPHAPPQAMVLYDNDNPHNPVVFKRGKPGNNGPAVPRQYLQVIEGKERKAFSNGSGRLELARALTAADNPLTARVIVNRVWMYHFGQPLVATPSDFGLRSDPPTHPELLDYLATRFMKEGWSFKKLHRLMMLTSAYQQSSAPNSEYRQKDPDNKLLWRMNRQRLDFEAMRDSLLFVAGNLDLKMGGRSVDITTQPFTNRRTVYAFIDRQNLPNIFRTFDLASPDSSSPGRYKTTVPQQALFLLNSPFVMEQARRLLKAPELTVDLNNQEKIRHIYQKIYGRTPEDQELRLGEQFVAAPTTSANSNAWEQYTQALLLSNEFLFVD